ncbi:hypothetical protein FRC01_004426 [Tulasnella sp. 417]|nr:hypothetical protein FRC01_004426 [Tulasnella sp. 417]
MNCPSSSVTSETFGSPSRGTSLTSPTEESFPSIKAKSAPSSQQLPALKSTPVSTKGHTVCLSPSSQLSPSRANPTKSVGTTLYDPGPVSPLHSPTRSKAFSNGNLVHHPSPRSTGDLPVTPVRRRTAKELIDHFEQSGGSAPRAAPAMKLSATAPTGSTPRTPLSETRLNGPLPALPIKEPFAQHWQPSSPSRSPIRSLMNMVGLGRKGKHTEGDVGWKGRRKRSVSPIPIPRRTRALLAEDDETPIPPRSFESEAEYRLSSYRSKEDRMDAVTMKTISDNHATPVRDNPGVLRDLADDEENPILRTGPLLYLINTAPETWCNTQAVLQTPYLTLSEPRPTPTPQEESPSSSAFRSFGLRYCAVESLPCVILNGLAGSPLGLCGSSPLIGGPRDIALYVFEISFPEPSPGIKGKKEQFATTSAWDRGKWVCHLWDAICAANVSPKTDQDVVSTSGASPAVETGVGDGLTDDSDADLCTRRLQPPLRVVNVSKLSAFYDIDTIGSTKGVRLSSDESGRLTTRPALTDASSSAIAPNSIATPPTTVPPVPFNANLPLRSAPLQKPSPYDVSQVSTAKGEDRKTDRAANARSRSVPCSPSINNLGKMTLVQQRLARFESTKEGGGTHNVDMETRGRSPRPLPIRPVARASPRPIISSTGLSTPPISPTKATDTQCGLASNRTVACSSFSNRTIFGTVPSRNDQEGLPSPRANPERGESPAQNVAHSTLGSKIGYAGPVSLSSLGKADQGHEGEATVQAISGPGVRPVDSDFRHQSAATVSTSSTRRLSGLSSLPEPEHPDIAPLFNLVRDSALEQAAQVKALTEELEALRNEIVQGSKESPAVTRDGKEMALRAIGRAERLEKTDELAGALELIHSQLSGITTDVENLAASQQSDENRALTTELRETLPRLSPRLAGIYEKVEHLSVMRGTLEAMNEASCADRALWAQKLDGIVGNFEALKLDGVHERLDGIRASLAVLEAIAQSQQGASTSIGPISAFRKSSEAPAPTPNAPIDLSPLQEKLDALALKHYGPTDEVMNRLQEQVQSVVELFTNFTAGLENKDLNVPPGVEQAQEPEIPKLLERLKEERADQEKYFTDLNSWLQANATQTSSQYHDISKTLQQVTQALAPLASEASSPDASEVPASDAEPRQTKGSVLQEIREALLENNARNRANDNFLAAANHLIGAANAERQNLTALIASQREENERLLTHFANQITSEIRGQKHSFVDAMEKATALNVEGQLRELKTQISGQLLEMARGVERLSEERKVLEHQIAELLAFKSRFTPADYSDMPSISPGEYMPQVVPRSSQQRLQAEPAGQGRRPVNSQPPSRGQSRSPSPAPVSKRPLPNPNQFHPTPNQTLQVGQRF